MSGISEGDPRTEYRRRNAQLRANQQRPAPSRPQPTQQGFSGGLFNFNETGRDPRTEYRRRKAQNQPGTGVAVVQQVQRRNNTPLVEPTSGDPRTRYRTIPQAQPTPPASQARVNRADPPVDRSNEGGYSFLKVLGSVIEDNFLELVQARSAVAAPPPAPPPPVVQARTNHARIPDSFINLPRDNGTDAAPSPSTPNSAQSTVLTEEANTPSIPITPPTPTTPHTPHVHTAQYDGLDCDPEWLAAIAHIDDVDHPPDLSPTHLPQSVLAEDKETSQLSDHFGDNVFLGDCDYLDYEWLEATSSIPDVDIPPECVLEEVGNDVPPVNIQDENLPVGDLVAEYYVVGNEESAPQHREQDNVPLVFAPPVVLTDAERQALFEQMMADMDVVEHHENEDLSDDEVSELGNTTIVPADTAVNYAVMEELDRLRAELNCLNMRSSLTVDMQQAHAVVCDEASVHTAPA